MADNTFSSDDFDALLDDFINKQLEEVDDILLDINEKNENSSNNNVSNLLSANNLDDAKSQNNNLSYLAQEEQQLFNAYKEFISSVKKCATSKNIDIPDFDFSEQDLLPRFNPHRMDNLKKDISLCWDLMIKAERDILKDLPLDVSDEQILNFAEKINSPNLQLSLISYVETLIEIENCETAYNIRKTKYQKYKIEKELYEQQQQHIARKRLYAQAIRDKNFPVDADLLVNNFFKAANKDLEGAQQMLEFNPAIFAPILVDKIPNRFFGFIKAKPSDGIRINKELGKFLINLKI